MNTASLEKLHLITLVGPPNSGKTTLFNQLSGKNFKTVNYPGSTVEYSTCKIQSKFGIQADVLDSPGIISLNPNSPDEEVSINSLYNHPELGAPNLLIATADASQISRHLLLAKQLIESGFNVIVAITMNDILAKRGYEVDENKLAEQLGCGVVKVDGRSGKGIDKLLSCVKPKLSADADENKSHPFKAFENIRKKKLLTM